MRPVRSLRQDVVAPWLAFVTLLAFSAAVLGMPTGPLTGVGDTSYYEYTGYFLSRHLSLTPLPHVDFVTNDVLFPFGGNVVMQPWGFERDFLYAVLTRLGHGPWLQLYWFLSHALTVFGIAHFLRRDFGAVRAYAFPTLATIFNAYLVHKYPHHFNICTMHWVWLAFTVDFLLVYGVVQGRGVSLRLVVLRAALLLLSLGLELGYVFGYGLTSAVFCAAVVLLLRGAKVEGVTLALEKDATRRHYVFLAVATLVAGFVYLPLIRSLLAAIHALPPMADGGVWSAHPTRLLLPIFPWLDPASASVTQALGGTEDYGEGTAGWFVLGTALCGSVAALRDPKLRMTYLPFLLLFLFLAFYRTEGPFALRFLPWLKFHRVGGRTTALFPFLLLLPILAIPPEALRTPRGRTLGVLLGALGLVELYTSFVVRRQKELLPFPQEARSLLETIRKTEGRTLLTYPYCIAGGNGVGTLDLCPYYIKLSTEHTLSRFHEKKVWGAYLSRYHESQLTPWENAHYKYMFFPDRADFPNATGQKRCLREDEWQFFEEALKVDSAGIILYEDLLPPGCADAWEAHFGLATARGTLPNEGRARFIPTPARLRGPGDIEALKKRTYPDPMSPMP